MDIRQSVDRVLASKKIFGEIFYEEFFRRSPHAHAHFEGIDMERQSLMLTMALPAIALWNSDTDALRLVRSFGYEDFRDRIS